MEIITIQKYINTSPRKLRLVADLVRKMKPMGALTVLEHTNKAAAEPMSKAIKTVMANAKQQGIDEGSLSFSKIEVNEGTGLRRMHAGSRGRANAYKKRTSSIKIVLSDEKGEGDGTKD